MQLLLQQRLLWLAAAMVACVSFAVLPARPQSAAAPLQPGQSLVKPDARRARNAFKIGQAAEQKQDWKAAYDDYSEAAEYAPTNRQYVLRRELAKGALVQFLADAAERDAISGRMEDARRDLYAASALDPNNSSVAEQLKQLLDSQPGSMSVVTPLGGELRLNYRKGTHTFHYRGDTKGAYNEIARQFGVETSFDPDVTTRAVQFDLDDADFTTATRVLGVMTQTFWQPLTPKVFVVANDTASKHRAFDQVAVRTVTLPASQTPDQMTETLRVIRDLTGITRADLDVASHTITLRASSQALAVATDAIGGIEQPAGEMVLEMEILEVDRNFARQLGITPPQTAQVVTLTPQEIQEASQSASNLVTVINQIFGLPGSLSGLSPTQIAGLLGSGNLSASTLIPPVVAFGGGQSTFLATLPGASATFSEMLSLVKHGDRIFLRAQDGQAATFFDGERFPISLANFSSSLTGTTVPGLSSTNFPTTNYPAGNSPQFIASAILRASSTINDLIVANQVDGTVGVLLGNGGTKAEGTFASQAVYPTDPANSGSTPVWIATGDFNGDGHPDLAVANKNSNNIGILLASAAGDGTFQTATTVPTGVGPVSVVSGLFHDATTNSHLDIAVANQGDNTIWVYQGNGDGTFVAPAAPIQLPLGYSPAGLVAADLNADGHTDLVVADEGNNTVSVFLGNGDGTFQQRVDYPTGNSPVYVAAADLNADGVPDLAIANNGAANSTNSGDSVTILLGQKNTAGAAIGTFAAGTTRDFPAGVAPTSLVIGDFNVDGLPDIVVANGNRAADATAGDNAVSVLLGAGNGSFSPNFELPVGTNPQSLVTEDFNADSKLDVATANAGSNNITVVLNSSSVFGGNNPGGLNGSGIGTPYPNVQYVDLGIKIKATPRIHTTGDVTLALEFTLTSLGSQSFNSIPAISNETLQQTVRLKQDETTTIASFLSGTNTKNLSGTPGIAGLPVLGWLAQNESPSAQDDEILILVTPRMVRRAEKKDRIVYAGQGALEGQGAASVTTPIAPPPIPVAAGAPQPGQPAPGAPATNAQPTVPPPGQPPNEAQPGQLQPQPTQPAQPPVNPPDQGQPPQQPPVFTPAPAEPGQAPPANQPAGQPGTQPPAQAPAQQQAPPQQNAPQNQQPETPLNAPPSNQGIPGNQGVPTNQAPPTQ